MRLNDGMLKEMSAVEMGKRQAMYDYAWSEIDGAYVMICGEKKRLEEVVDYRGKGGKKKLRTKDDWRDFWKAYIWMIDTMTYEEDGKRYVGKKEKKRLAEEVREEAIKLWQKITGDSRKKIEKELITLI